MFGRPVTLFTVLSFRVRADASWLALGALIVWGLAVGYFPEMRPGLAPGAYWVMGVAGFLGLGLSIVAHELAHAVVGRRFHMPFHGITLFLFGGVAELEAEPSGPRGEALMALAGPAMSLALALLCLGLSLADTAAAPVLAYLAFINLLLAGFNLIPAFPLDGGRVLRAVLWHRTGDMARATRTAGRCGEVLAWTLMAAGLWQVADGNALGGTWWMLIGLFVRAAARNSVRQQLRHAAFAGARVGRFAEGVAVAADLPLDRLEDHFHANPLSSLPVTWEGRLVGRVRLSAAERVPPAERPWRTVAEIAEPCPEDATIVEDAAAAAAHGRMARTGQRHLLVTTGDGALVGVVRQSALVAFLARGRRAGALPETRNGRPLRGGR